MFDPRSKVASETLQESSVTHLPISLAKLGIATEGWFETALTEIELLDLEHAEFRERIGGKTTESIEGESSEVRERSENISTSFDHLFEG